MCHVVFHPVVLADELLNVVSFGEAKKTPDFPWSGVGAGILDRDLEIHVPHVDPAVAFDYVQLFSLRSATFEPPFVVEAPRVDDECVTLPRSNRMTEPRGIEVFGVLPAIEEDLSRPRYSVFHQRDEHRRCLNELDEIDRMHADDACGEAPRSRVFARAIRSFFRQRCRPGLERWRLGLDIGAGQPHAAEIGFAFARSRRLSGWWRSLGGDVL